MDVIVGIADDFVAHPAAEQLVHRHAKRLALDVPQGDVDGRDGRAQDALGGKKAAAEQPLPDVFYAKGVLAHQNFFEVLDGADHRLLAAGQTGLAHAEDPFVGINDDEEKVAMAGPDRIGGDVGNLHRMLLGVDSGVAFPADSGGSAIDVWSNCGSRFCVREIREGLCPKV